MRKQLTCATVVIPKPATLINAHRLRSYLTHVKTHWLGNQDVVGDWFGAMACHLIQAWDSECNAQILAFCGAHLISYAKNGVD